MRLTLIPREITGLAFQQSLYEIVTQSPGGAKWWTTKETLVWTGPSNEGTKTTEQTAVTGRRGNRI